ncbi:NCK-interacting protein with SH3 domain-like [Amphiura filiformis]|uniref:NCK-interacting protein with SH3 domain-like n=1 Tax=Amphiura filiformis TaxID=82378 RepID=UPI003B221EFE
MYRAIYSFQCKDAGGLSFREGEKFTVLDQATDPHWWKVANDHGRVGYVPANYIQKETSKTEEVLKSIDNAMEFIHMAATSKGGVYTKDQRDTLQKLLEHRQLVLNDQSTGAPSQPSRTAPDLNSTHRTSTKTRTAPSPPSSGSPPPPSMGTKSSVESNTKGSEDKSDQSKSRNMSTKSRSAPPPPQRADVTPTETEVSSPPTELNSRESPTTSPVRSAPVAPNSTSSSVTSSPLRSPTRPAPTSPPMSPTRDQVIIPPRLGVELVEKVRVNTGLSHDKSQLAIATVICHMRDSVPGLADAMEVVLANLERRRTSSSSTLPLEGGHDQERLQVIFQELTECKDDSQQRSWALHEDERIITDHLQELITILSDADPKVCRAVIQQNHYEAIHDLVLYYQMELRSSLRLLLLKTFGALCGLDPEALSNLLSSILPVELARDMQTDTQNIQKLTFSALVCTMLLSSGEPIPYTHYDIFTEDFVTYLLDKIDDPPESDEDEQIPDLFVNLILAYNLHFRVPADNIVMKALAGRRTVKTFSEKIMLLVNRGEDPVRMFDHEPKPPDSLLKMMGDIFSSSDTSGIFYTNDMMVFIDIIIRQLNDLSSGDSVRTEYLSLIHSILMNTPYFDHRHRLDELQRVFAGINEEEGEESQQDKLILAEVKKLFPHDCPVRF